MITKEEPTDRYQALLDKFDELMQALQSQDTKLLLELLTEFEQMLQELKLKNTIFRES